MTRRATWKDVERAVARLLGGTRVPITGRSRGDVPDIAHPTFAVEVKLRGSLPGWLVEAMSQAEASVRDDQIPLAVLHRKGARHRDDLCVLALADLVALVERDGDA